MRNRGTITVFVALLIPVLAGFVLTLSGAVNTYVAESEAELAVDNAVRSCFAEYNRELYDRYHYRADFFRDKRFVRR